MLDSFATVFIISTVSTTMAVRTKDTKVLNASEMYGLSVLSSCLWAPCQPSLKDGKPEPKVGTLLLLFLQLMTTTTTICLLVYSTRSCRIEKLCKPILAFSFFFSLFLFLSFLPSLFPSFPYFFLLSFLYN